MIKQAALTMIATCAVHPSAAALEPDAGWERLQVVQLRTSASAPSPLRDLLRRIWADRLEEDERRWRASPGPSGGSYPVRAQWALLEANGQRVVVSAISGIFECSPSGSFTKEDLFTWCPLRVQVAGKAPAEISSACWIESEPGAVADPHATFMRARVEAARVRVQVVQHAQSVPVCDKVVDLP
jgi:hypothetical protein